MHGEEQKWVDEAIIIPVFNVKPYLNEAIDSVLLQTYRNLEIILIDDGSTDGSGSICDEYAKIDSRIKVVHQKNFGLSPARNRGLDMMNGQAVAFLDSDDAYSHKYIQTMINAMVQAQTDLVICKYIAHKTSFHMSKTEKTQTEPKCGQGCYTRTDALRSLAEGLIDMRAWNKLYKRDLWNHIRFPDGHVYEDKATLNQGLSNIDYEVIKQEIENRFRAVVDSGDYKKVIRIFNEKGLEKSIGHFMSIVDKAYCQIAIGMLRNDSINIDELLGRYLPDSDVIPR